MKPVHTTIIHLVDDDGAFRASQRLFLTVMGYEVKEWSSPLAFLADANLTEPGCVVLDLRMPEMTGLEVQDELVRRSCPLPVIILTGHGDVDAAVHTLKGGAVDFIAKSKDPDLLLAAVKKACTQSLLAAQKADSQHRMREEYESLTMREREVFLLAAEGLSNKEISEKLGIGTETIKMHRANAFAKTGVRSALEAYRWLLIRGIIREPQS